MVLPIQVADKPSLILICAGTIQRADVNFLPPEMED